MHETFVKGAHHGKGKHSTRKRRRGSLSIAGSTAVVPISRACAAQAQMSYSEDVEPIFKGWCVSCHQPGGQGSKASGLDLTTYEGLMKGTKFGPMVIPGKPDESNLMVLIQGDARYACPLPTSRCPIVFARTSGHGSSRARRTIDRGREHSPERPSTADYARS